MSWAAEAKGRKRIKGHIYVSSGGGWMILVEQMRQEEEE